MRTSMKWMIVIGEVLLFGLAVCAISQAADDTYYAYAPAQAQPVHAANRSPYSTARAPAENYRVPAALVPRYPVTAGLVQTSPARESDLLPTSSFSTVNYPELTSLTRAASGNLPLTDAFHQVNYRTAAAAPRTVVPASYTAPPTVVQYPPAPTYSAPNFSAPVVGVPHTVFSPVTPAPVVRADVQVGRGIYGQPVIYRPGQPLRNAWRWLTP